MDNIKLPRTNKQLRKHKANSSLPKDAWEEVDSSVVAPFRRSNNIIGDLMDAGLTQNIDFYTTKLSWAKHSGMNQPTISLTGEANLEEDDISYEYENIAVVTVHEDYSLGEKRMRASGSQEITNIDTTIASQAGISVKDQVNDIFVNGYDKITIRNGAAVYGFKTYPNNINFTISNDWDTSTPGDPYIIDDMKNILGKLDDNAREGPKGVWVPSNYWRFLQGDYSPEAGKTWRERLLQFPDIEFIHFSKHLDDDEVLIVELTDQTVEVAMNTYPAETIQWQSGDGWSNYFKTWATAVPKIKSDKDGNCGVVYATT